MLLKSADDRLLTPDASQKCSATPTAVELTVGSIPQSAGIRAARPATSSEPARNRPARRDRRGTRRRPSRSPPRARRDRGARPASSPARKSLTSNAVTSLAQCRGFGRFTHTGWQTTPVCNLLTGQVTFDDLATIARALFDLLRSTWKGPERDYARYFAVAMVYYALMSLVPLLLLMLATLGLLLRFTDLATVAEEQLLRYVESSFGLQIRATLGQLLEQAGAGVGRRDVGEPDRPHHDRVCAVSPVCA